MEFSASDSRHRAISHGGSGAPLVVLSGTANNDQPDWPLILSMLGPHFSLFTVEPCEPNVRPDPFTLDPDILEQTAADLSVLLDTFAEPVGLLGHAFGAIWALEIALHSSNIRKVILYEPSLGSFSLQPVALVSKIQLLIERQDWEELMTLYYSEIRQIPRQDIEAMRLFPFWSSMRSMAYLIFREFDSARGYAYDPKRFTGMTLPALFLVEGDRTLVNRVAINTWNSTLPDSRLAVLPGTSRVGKHLNCQLLIQEVVQFLTAEPDPV